MYALSCQFQSQQYDTNAAKNTTSHHRTHLLTPDGEQAHFIGKQIENSKIFARKLETKKIMQAYLNKGKAGGSGGGAPRPSTSSGIESSSNVKASVPWVEK